MTSFIKNNGRIISHFKPFTVTVMAPSLNYHKKKLKPSRNVECLFFGDNLIKLRSYFNEIIFMACGDINA